MSFPFTTYSFPHKVFYSTLSMVVTESGGLTHFDHPLCLEFVFTSDHKLDCLPFVVDISG
ncbi:hypothetical protein CW304_18820 [Bacillus sp. UFRGS-B20]|nr:hypothetical protein CW304_18820 [Bacillus sp. UFRGS-B20]